MVNRKLVWLSSDEIEDITISRTSHVPPYIQAIIDVHETYYHLPHELKPGFRWLVDEICGPYPLDLPVYKPCYTKYCTSLNHNQKYMEEVKMEEGEVIPQEEAPAEEAPVEEEQA